MFRRILVIVFLQAAIGYCVLPETFAGDIDGQGLYTRYCVLCHGEDGTGQTDLGAGLGARDFNEKAFQDGITDEQIVEQIAKGTEDKMMPFEGKLTPEEMHALVPIIRAFGK
ncbi:cytochrome c, mono- and diheme variants [Candidatus Scalindua japonica]|uniref:Cytochrome c, mono-and diheme variants n=1 Tax=Candidatus Scalindua japonica TaxID=1284222 RepID=A0A286U120_9BACT|nr:cytochrome c [Candidatus Scalindua japonica]GAX61860.1 cytochrome c, mono- and diheme variants [Candidatus Scalindua japonica]